MNNLKITLDNIDDVLLNDINDVKAFFIFLMKDQKLILHPDNSFEDYGRFSPDQSKILDELMEACFVICSLANKDVYEIALDLMAEFDLF